MPWCKKADVYPTGGIGFDEISTRLPGTPSNQNQSVSEEHTTARQRRRSPQLCFGSLSIVFVIIQTTEGACANSAVGSPSEGGTGTTTARYQRRLDVFDCSAQRTPPERNPCWERIWRVFRYLDQEKRLRDYKRSRRPQWSDMNGKAKQACAHSS